ncbi:hypothetical protein KO465_03915 [Candidatus Micrarchaeota archaeon]|jgi:hypothetical protein|nr:hypothetical protein [Candidatus Micrarchaeota archaeon]
MKNTKIYEDTIRDIEIYNSHDTPLDEKNNARMRTIERFKAGEWSDRRQAVDAFINTPNSSRLMFFVLGDSEINEQAKIECIEGMCSTHGSFNYLIAGMTRLMRETTDIVSVERLTKSAAEIFKREGKYSEEFEEAALVSFHNKYYVGRKMPSGLIHAISDMLSARENIKNSQNPQKQLRVVWEDIFEKFNFSEKLREQVSDVLNPKRVSI